MTKGYFPPGESGPFIMVIRITLSVLSKTVKGLMLSTAVMTHPTYKTYRVNLTTGREGRNAQMASADYEPDSQKVLSQASEKTTVMARWRLRCGRQIQCG